MYVLANVEERNRAHPDTFHIQSRSRREALMVGDSAKLIFEEKGVGTERMWLRILAPVSDGRYYGELANQPVMISGILPGDRIEFGPEHVAETQKELLGLWNPGLVTHRPKRR